MTNQNVVDAAERYLSRQPHCESDEDGNPLYTRNQMLRAFCAGEIAIIDQPSPGTRTITGETARGADRHLSPPSHDAAAWRTVTNDGTLTHFTESAEVALQWELSGFEVIPFYRTTPPPSSQVLGGDDLRKRVMFAIFDPGAAEGFKGDRDLTTWQTDAVMKVLSEMPNSAGSQIPDSAEVRHGARVDDRTLPGGAGSPKEHVRAFYGELLVALSRLAGNRQSDGTSSTVSREDRETIINGCHDLMIAARQAPPNQLIGPQCCMCGKKNLSTAEGDGGTECELADGRWVCSAECWDRAVSPAEHVMVPDVRALAVEIVDGVRGYTYEFSSHPSAHAADYDLIEDKLRAVLNLTKREN
ncbi:hypothetical protein ACK9YZ_01170 [Rhizobium sp. ZK1]|uniref:hypothetical protein n=1 Tax=Rhizobium sp. ZK1 TaxID=3389872 RepID=UPI0039F65999